jgi:hypothetical protein
MIYKPVFFMCHVIQKIRLCGRGERNCTYGYKISTILLNNFLDHLKIKNNLYDGHLFCPEKVLVASKN